MEIEVNSLKGRNGKPRSSTAKHIPCKNQCYSSGLTSFDMKQLREQIQNKFDQQSKTNKLIFDSIQLVAGKIKEITEEKYE